MSVSVMLAWMSFISMASDNVCVQTVETTPYRGETSVSMDPASASSSPDHDGLDGSLLTRHT